MATLDDSSSDSDFSLIEDEAPVSTSSYEDNSDSPALEPPSQGPSMPATAPDPPSQSIATPTANSVETLYDHQLHSLQSQITENPYQYHLHVERIHLLRQLNRNLELEHARNAMHQVFSLGEDLWLDWIHDRKAEHQMAADLSPVFGLYQKAIQDCYSVQIWLSYLEFAIGAFKHDQHLEPDSPGHISLDNLRAVFRTATHSVGHHYTQGYLVWEPIRQFEEALIAHLDDQSARQQQISHVNTLYHEALVIPSPQLEALFSCYSSFVSEHRNDTYEATMVEANRLYSQARAKCAKRDGFELQLTHAADPLLHYYKYIHALQQDPKGCSAWEIQTLYERALVGYFSTPSLWENYIQYSTATPELSPNAHQLCERSVKSCPWSGSVWAHFMRTSELHFGSVPHPDTIFNTALQYFTLSPALEELVLLCLAKLGYYLRQYNATTGPKDAGPLRSVYTECTQLTQQLLGTYDPFYRLELHQIELETRQLNDVKRANAIWDHILTRNPTDATLWVDCADFKLRYQGGIAAARAVCQRALRKPLDWPDRLYLRYQSLERLYGKLETLQAAVHEIAQARIRNSIRDQRALAVHQQAQVQEEQKLEHKRERSRANKKKRWQQQQQQQQRNPESQQTNTAERSATGAAPSQKRVSTKDMDVDDGPQTKRAKTSDPSEPTKTKFSDAMAVNKGASSSQTTKVPSAKDSGRTVLVGNLASVIKERDLKAWFQSCGTVTHTHLVRDTNGRLKGYGYVQYATAAEADRAVHNQNGALWNDDPNCRITVHHRAASEAEPNTVYVCNFPASIVEQDLRALFSTVGDVQQVRMPAAQRAGKAPRRFAYVEFVHAADAQAAVAQLDGYTGLKPTSTGTTNPWPLSVAISNPMRARPESQTMDQRDKAKSTPNKVLSVPDAKKTTTLRMTQFKVPVKIESIRSLFAKTKAFIEYATIAEAEAAQNALNGSSFHGAVIRVHYAAPPSTTSNLPQVTSVLASASPAAPMVPRRLRRIDPKPSSAPKIAASNQPVTESLLTATPALDDPSSATKPKPKSNADFRQLFLSGR
ncbi:Splicing factor [Dimargaris verticillata]|uniref:Splicing factor n=1 Tax=Dimargaris verticillata TaxID=2761393 RepID=A0A9W8B2C6_9FUNG|nr:Splicing factor [Dimargaris verticillata]